MNPTLPLTLLACGCACWTQVEEPCHEPVEVTVTRVVDGDTFDIDPAVEVEGAGRIDRVRLLCIDTPEISTGPECYGEEARDWLAEQIEGETVTLRFDDECLGEYGRLLVYVVQHGRLVNERLAREGFALPAADRYLDYGCCENVLDAVSKAQDHYDGGWGECTGSPWIP